MSDKIKEATEKVEEAAKKSGSKAKKFIKDHKTLLIGIGCGVGGYFAGKYLPGLIGSLAGATAEVAEAAVETVV